jgi:multiple sugar transport system substrate-binding protein
MNGTTKRIMLGLVVLMGLIAIVSAGAQKTTLEFWLYGGTPDNIDWNKAQIADWNAKNPNIQINMTLQSWNTMFEHFQTAAATRTLPDVARIHGSMITQYGGGGFLEPFDNFSDWSTVKKDYIAGYLSALQVNNKQYAFAQSGLIFVLMGNKKLFDAAGLPGLPTSWTQLKQYAKKLTKADQWGYSIVGANARDFTYRWSEYMLKAGGEVMNADWSKSMVTGAAWQGAVQLFADMKKDGSLDPAFLATDYEGQLNKIAANKVAMWLEGGYIVGGIMDKAPNMQLLFGAVPAPDKALGPAAQGTLQDVSAIVMSATSKNKPSAWKFMKWYTGPGLDKDYVLKPEISGLPVCIASMALPEWKKIPGFNAYQAEGPTVRAMPASPKLVEMIEQGWTPPILKAINGDLSAAEALKIAQTACDAILARK